MKPALVLTFDLDGPPEYARLHGLAPEEPSPVMLAAPLERFATLCRELGGVGTVFAIGRDLELFAQARQALRTLHDEGFEVASHSFAHDYHLSRRSTRVIDADLSRASDAIASATGTAPRGFRAPGYHLSPALLDVLEAQGFRYDSSIFPSPLYYLAKAAVLAWYRACGRQSAALLGSIRTTLAPHTPFRPGVEPTSRGQRRLVELPVAAPWGLPATGAAAVALPNLGRELLTRALATSDVIVLNLHAIDLCDASALPSAIVRRQPELKLAASTRLTRLRELTTELSRGRAVTSCLGLLEGNEGLDVG